MSTARPIAVLPLLIGAACTIGGPAIDPIDDQIVAVGDELLIELHASSPRDEALEYGYTSNSPDPYLSERATVSPRPDGSGLFRFQPSARDIGVWVFDFTAADGSGEDSESIQIEVRSAIGANTIPLFRRPVGAGTAVYLTRDGCMEMEIETSDQDSLEVSIVEEEPKIEGAELLQDRDMAATWRWCPTDDQRQVKDRYLLTLSADDGDNPKAIKRYQIILREKLKETCLGANPVIVHTPGDRSTVNDLEVVAQVSDDSGLKAAPLLYYSSEPIADPPDPANKPIQLNMQLATGDQRQGTWKATIPNPVGRDASGAQQIVYYALVAEDDDDGLGDCDHITTQMFQMNVSTPGGDGELGLCSACTSDNQCGGADDHCLRVGVEGAAFCMSACSGDGQCPSGYVCSAAELESIEGATGRQCVPADESCLETASGCQNDALENNDSQEKAQPLEAGETDDLALCPIGTFGGEDDWYRIQLDQDSDIEIALDGAADPDMDLDLVDEDGMLVSLTWDSGSQDVMSECLPAGTYFIRAFSFFSGENRYAIRWSASPGTCEEDDWWSTCWDDASEEDDGTGAARVLDLDEAVVRSDGNQICSGDDDWYQVYLYEGEVLSATLAFEVGGPGEDLDFHVHDSSGTDLTPCSVEEPWECSSNGQSGGSGEQIAFTADGEGTYYLVVRGWDGAENGYDLCASLSDTACQ